MDKERPKIGTAVWIRKDEKVLIGKRTGKPAGSGTWFPPGGHLEMNETLLECVIRETVEEATIEIQNIKFVTVNENIWKDMETHFVTIYFVADWKSGEPVPQPGEYSEWGWFTWDALPNPLFKPAEIFVETGLNPLEL